MFGHGLCMLTQRECVRFYHHQWIQQQQLDSIRQILYNEFAKDFCTQPKFGEKYLPTYRHYIEWLKRKWNFLFQNNDDVDRCVHIRFDIIAYVYCTVYGLTNIYHLGKSRYMWNSGNVNMRLVFITARYMYDDIQRWTRYHNDICLPTRLFDSFDHIYNVLSVRKR